ncbi:MAG: DUF4143 domain-containing protein, partial [Candidatus Paceibacterota bacterium]
LKEPKIYFFDTGMVVGDAGVKFENFVAMSFFKNALAKIDYTGQENEVKYLRTKDGKEVDFVLAEGGRIASIAEIKFSDGELSKNLSFFSEKYNLNGVQIVKELKREKTIGKIDVVDAGNYLKDLFL